MVHLAFLVRELARATTGVAVDEVRGDEFFISGGTGPVEDELDEGTLELGALAPVHGEACSGDFHAGLEVDETVLIGQFPMRLGRIAQIGFGAFFIDDFVVGVRLPCGNAVVRAVGQFEQGGFLLLDEGLLLLVQFVDALLEFADLCAARLGFRFLPGFEQVSDFPTGRILLGLEVVDLLLGGAALQVELEDAVEQGSGIESALGKGGLDGIAVVAEGLKGQHGL